MKENINYLTAALIVIFIAALSYNYINKEKVEITEDLEEEVEAAEGVTPVSQVVIRGEIKWAKNTVDSNNRYYRKARFFTRDTSISTKLDWRGGFNLTFPLDSSGYITFHHGNETTAMYCNPDDTVHITINTKQFDETITYTGSEESSFLAWQFLHIENMGYPNVKKISDTSELNQQLDDLINPMLIELSTEDFNIDFIKSQKEGYTSMKNYFLEQYAKNQNMLEMIGKPAIDFTYPDMDSNMVSLSDFKGSYVYVDVWATWCGPCKYEIPFLLQLEKDYHDANIIFMSVSVDVENAKQKWIDMINEKNMGGVQLFANGWSQICKDYSINGIPRFMLFDPDGNVISVDAARPSSDEIRETFDGFKNIEEETEEVEEAKESLLEEEEAVNL